MKGTARAMIEQMESALGWREPWNTAQEWYAKRNGKAFGTAAWCDMLITWAAFHSGCYDAVCFGKDWAYTVWHAERGKARDRWRYGHDLIPGDIVFFQWEGGTRSIGKIDHVGIVVKDNGDTFETIEGNTSDRCMRRIRKKNSTVTGFIRPVYVKEGDGMAKDGTWSEQIAVPDYGKDEYPNAKSYSAAGWLRGANIFARNARDEGIKANARMVKLEKDIEQLGRDIAKLRDDVIAFANRLSE